MAVPKLCSIPGCGKPSIAHGWCNGHYKRFKRHGDPLGGGLSSGAAMRYFRETVLPYRGDECLPWPFANNKGYGLVRFRGRQWFVSRAVCESIHGHPPTPTHEAAHTCGRGWAGCCTPRHIVWKTPTQNQADRKVHGTDQFGEKNTQSKLSDAAVREIRSLKGTATLRELGDRYGMTPSAIGYVLRGKTWAHVK